MATDEEIKAFNTIDQYKCSYCKKTYGYRELAIACEDKCRQQDFSAKEYVEETEEAAKMIKGKALKHKYVVDMLEQSLQSTADENRKHMTQVKSLRITNKEIGEKLNELYNENANLLSQLAEERMRLANYNKEIDEPGSISICPSSTEFLVNKLKETKEENEKLKRRVRELEKSERGSYDIIRAKEDLEEEVVNIKNSIRAAMGCFESGLKGDD